MEHNKDKVHTSQTQGGYVYIDVLEEAKEEKKKGKCITIGIETEENDIEIGIIRAENDIKEEETEVHLLAESNTTCACRPIVGE